MTSDDTKTVAMTGATWFPPPPAKPPPYKQNRRVWERVPMEERRETVAALTRLCRRRELPWLLLGVLVLSLAVHAATMPFVSFGRDVDMESLAGREDSYFRKIVEKTRAGKVAKTLAQRVTMPPPPEDPEKVVAEAFATSLTSDVAKVTKDLLTVELQAELAAHIKASLKDEIAAAAEAAARGDLSPEELAALQEGFRKKAHTTAVEWQQEYRKEHQVEIAKVSTLDWYEKYVSIALVNNLKWLLFGNKLVNPYFTPRLWWTHYPGLYTGWTKDPAWGDLRSNGYLAGKIQQLDLLAAGLVRTHPKKEFVDSWPEPSRAQAEYLLKRLRWIHTGHHPGTYPSPSWRNVIYGGADEHVKRGGRALYCRMSDGIIEEYYIHCPGKVRPIAKRLDELWERALAAAADYAQQAKDGTAGTQLKAAQTACLDAMKAIVPEAKKLLVSDARGQWPRGPHRSINAVVRSQVLRSTLRKNKFDYWVNSMTSALEPLMKQMVENEFQKGIIVEKEGLDKVRQLFAKEIVPRLRRDVMAAFPEKSWNKRVFDSSYPYRGYRSKTTGEGRKWPDAGDVKAEEKVLADWLAKRPDLRAYAEKRRERNIRYFAASVERVKETMLLRILAGDVLMRSWRSFVEGVDYADKVQEKLDARKRAKEGRGQDLASLTGEGIPDTSEVLVALMTGAGRGHGATLQPVKAMMRARYYTFARPETAVLSFDRVLAPRPEEWGFVTQAEVKPRFKGTTPKFEAIPFLHKFPRLDGDLSEWGRVRPLFLTPSRNLEPEKRQPIAVYAAWNYQGFFFAYQVKQRKEEFFWSAPEKMSGDPRKLVGWMFSGDYLHLMFDTLDARTENRGEPHTQEFVILPKGTEIEENTPGAERIIASQRDAKTKEYRGVKSSNKIFVQQPALTLGPDGTGPYRVTRLTENGYAVEVFIPRTLFNVPVFAPGWYIGFNCVVGMGRQGRHWTGYRGQSWAPVSRGGPSTSNYPKRWGDVLMLGTDPAMYVQDADATGSLTKSVVPGHSYLLTVKDPDRNVNIKTKDTVIVSAEVIGESNDVEVFVLQETRENSGVFRGYVDTQPGVGREVQGVLEVAPKDVVRLGYVDFADAKGRRNVVVAVRMPVASPLHRVANSGIAKR